MLFPQQTYRWVVWQNIIPNEGVLAEKKMVGIPPNLAVHFDSGFNIGKIVKSMLQRAEKPIPNSLNTIKQDTNKNTKLTNWNFIWLSFDDLDLRFDNRIKDLILQGQTALVVEVVKQLYEKDTKKDENAMKKVLVLEKAGNKSEKSVNIKPVGKPNTVDIKKINVQKDPEESESSLEFLIILLSSSLSMPVEQILGLFTNQNKYLAHIIVKGLNEEFSSIVLFYTLLNKHINKFKYFVDSDQKDAESLLYAIKPGFISKNPDVAQLTIDVFKKLKKNVYEWLIGESRGSTTLLLGFKRHPQLSYPLWDLLSHIIQQNDIQFFTNYFKQSFKDIREMVEICSYIVGPLSESYVAAKISDVGIFSEWIQMSQELFESNNVEDQVLTFNFLGEMMLHMPDAISQNEHCLEVFQRDWNERQFVTYLRLVDQIFLILDKLAANKSIFASKVYQILIDIFGMICSNSMKKEYLVENFSLIIPEYPKMPTQYFIKAYQGNYLDAADHNLIQTSIHIKDDLEGLIQIGNVLEQMYSNDAVANGYMGNNIYQIAKKVVRQQDGQQFIKKTVKNLLKVYGNKQINKKNPQVAKPQPMYFNYKGNSQKLTEQTYDNYRIQEKQTNNIIQLVGKLVGLANVADNDSFESYLKNQLLDANAFIRKNNFKINSKGITNILRKLGISKEDQHDYDEQYRNKKEVLNMEESLARKKNVLNNLSMLASSRIGGPEHLKKEFSDIVEKRRKQELQKKAEEEKKAKQQALKQQQMKKLIQRQKLARGYGTGQAELKDEGFWAKFIKEDKQLQIYPPTLMEQRDVDMIENLFKKYHRVVRFLFMKYTASMYAVKSLNNFQDNQNRKQTIYLMEIIKFLKDYKLFFLTSNPEIQNLVRDINVKLLNKKEETQGLEFTGFQHFLVQFSSVIFTKTHSINAKTNKGNQTLKKSLNHIGHGQLLYELFAYIKLVFQQKGQNLSMFDQPESVYFNEAEVIKQFNKKIQADPGFILPEGYKKVIDKNMQLNPKLSQFSLKSLKPAQIDVLEILDQILSQSQLGIHIIEPMTETSTKFRVKPTAFANVKPKLMTQSLDLTKNRAMSSLMERKTPQIPPVKMMERKVLSLGMKLGLSYVNYKDKLLGEQVAYVIDDMLNAVEQGKNTIEKQKIQNQIVKKRKEQQWMQRKMQSEKERKRKQRKQELQKQKKQITEKKQKQLEQTKQQREKKKQKKQSLQKKKKQDMQKYLADQKSKIKQKKEKQEEQKAKQAEQKKKKKQEEKKNKQKFKSFNEGQIQKLQKNFNDIHQKKKKGEQQAEEERKKQEEIKKKLRSKITADDRRIIEIRQKNNEEISELYSSEEIASVFKTFQPNLKALYDFLIKYTFTSLTQRSHNNEIIMETWIDFSISFQLNPYIINSKELRSIFRSLTKDKQIRKQYLLGLNFQEFQQALLRMVIKHKTVFNKISQKIREDDMTDKEINSVIDKDMEEKEKNQFDEPKEIDVKGLLVEEDINKEIIDDYGDIKKVTPSTLKGLIYYLKVPKDKAGQEKRFRQIVANKDSEHIQKYEKLKQKLKEEYSLASEKKKNNKSPSPQKKQESPPAKTKKK